MSQSTNKSPTMNKSQQNVYTSMTINAHHTLIQLKVVYRPCFSPSRIHKLFKGTSPIYVICSTDQGTLTHQFIQTNRLLTFWGPLLDFFTAAFNR